MYMAVEHLAQIGIAKVQNPSIYRSKAVSFMQIINLIICVILYVLSTLFILSSIHYMRIDLLTLGGVIYLMAEGIRKERL